MTPAASLATPLATLLAASLADFLDRHRRVALLSGAGISTASGIPDYRDADGVRRGAPPVQGPDFRRDEAVRRRYWARSMIGYPRLARAEPNAGHHAIARLQQARGMALVTQNVDGLHQRAGSGDVTELHGNIHGVACLACAARFPRSLIQSLLAAANPALACATARALPDGDAALEPGALSDFAPPCCPACGGLLMPDVVFFGDGVPPASSAVAERKVREADALLVVGSSLMVLSSFRLCRLAAAAGKPVAALNLGKTRADHLLALKAEAAAQDVLPALADLLAPAAATSKTSC